jgi:hypothetical protein
MLKEMPSTARKVLRRVGNSTTKFLTSKSAIIVTSD